MSALDQSAMLRLHVLLYEEDGCWVARCTDLGTLAADPDLETAWEDVVRVSRAHLEYHLAKGMTLDELVFPPPANISALIMQLGIDGRLCLHFDRKFSGGRQLEMQRFIVKEKPDFATV